MLPRPIVILGPTAGGKSRLAVEVAAALGGQIVGADSMQVYRHLEAGTAKPSAALRQRVMHHLIDVIEPTQRFTVHDWLRRAEPLIVDLQQHGRRPIIVGGTNLYIKALLHGLFEGPDQDAAFRDSLAAVPGVELHGRLRRVDPTAAERIAPTDRRRLTRALEVHHLTDKPISEQQTQWADQKPGHAERPEPVTKGRAHDPAPDLGPYRHNPILIGLHWPTDPINERINCRVKSMFYPARATTAALDHGCPPDGYGSGAKPESLPDETRRLEKAGLLGPQAREALGYKQVLESLAGHHSLDQAFERTKILSRRYAKQQRTWLRRYRQVHWLDAATLSSDELVKSTVRLVAPLP